HTGGKRAIDSFNKSFLSRLGIQEETTLPCVVFFKLKHEEIEDIAVAQLDSASLAHGLHELYGVIERYMSEELSDSSPTATYVQRLKAGAKFIALETFRTFLKEALAHWM